MIAKRSYQALLATVLVSVATCYNKSACYPQYGTESDRRQAPSEFTAHFSLSSHLNTTVVMHVVRKWSPNGADRFYQLMNDNYYNCASIFRVVPGFVVQFGLAADPQETAKWKDTIKDDSLIDAPSNQRGTITFATAGANTRTTQVFVNLKDNSGLDSQGFTPFARVVEGMELFDTVYNPTPSSSDGIPQQQLQDKGNVWVLQEYPNIEIIAHAEIVNEADGDESSDGNSSGVGPLVWAYLVLELVIFYCIHTRI